MEANYKNQNDYLERNGYFAEDITLDELSKGKELWRKWYRRQNKRKQRMKSKEIVVKLTGKEFIHLNRQAQDHNKKLSTYIREASLAYSKKLYLQPQKEVFLNIKQLLTITEISLRRIMDKTDDTGNLAPHSLSEIKTNLDQLSDKINTILNEPDLIFQSIQKHIKTNSSFEADLMNFIKMINDAD